MTAARWACVVAALGAAAYLLLDPATADHAAQEYRAGLVRDVGLHLWDNGWYGGHHTPAYSLLSPPLGALIGVRLAGALSAIVAAGLFGLMAERRWGPRAGSVAAAWFALGLVATLVSGRLTFALGVAFGLGAMLALQRGRWLAACALAALTTLASPVAGLFAAIAALAWALAPAPRGGSGAGTLSAATTGPSSAAGAGASSAAGATASSAPSAGAGASTAAGAAASSVPSAGAGASTAAGAAAFSAPSAGAGASTAAGAAAFSAPSAGAGASTAAGAAASSAPSAAARRLRGGALAAAALAPAAILAALFPEGGTEPFVASAFWPALAAIALVAIALPSRERALRIGAAIYALACVAAFVLPTALGGNATRLGALVAGPVVAGAILAARGRRAILAALVLPLAYWQLYPAVRDVVRASGDPSTAAAYHAPLVRFLEGRPGTFRVEIPFTENHWESAYVAPHIALARGWERQLDRRHGALFYDGTLNPATYRAWLDEHAVAYVAVPDAALDYSARDEARLVAAGLPYLRPVWRDAHWRVYAVRRPAPLVAGAARAITLKPDGFELRATRRGDALVRVRHTRWWSVTHGSACVEPGPGGMTRVRVLRPGAVRVEARLLGGSGCHR